MHRERRKEGNYKRTTEVRHGRVGEKTINDREQDESFKRELYHFEERASRGKKKRKTPLKRSQPLRKCLYQLGLDPKLPRERAERLLCVSISIDISISVHVRVGVMSDLDLDLGLILGLRIRLRVGVGVGWVTECLGGAEVREGGTRWRVGRRGKWGRTI